MYFGRNVGDITEETLEGTASRSRSLRQVAGELGIPDRTFRRYLTKPENEQIRGRLEDMVATKETSGTKSERWSIERDHYVFDIGEGRERYKVHREVWEDVCASYSRAGANMTKAQVAMEFDIPRPILEICLSLYGFYKANPPYTHEALLGDDDVENLVDDTLEMRQHRFNTALQQRELSFYRREVARLYEESCDRKRLIRLALEGAAEGVRGAARAVPKRIADPGGEGEWVAHAPVADLHVGKLVWAEEDFGDDYDLPEATRRLVEHGHRVAAWIQARGGRCTDAYLTDLGDFIHAVHSKTESGTPLHQDSRNKEIFRDAIWAKIRQIEAVRPQVGKVHVHTAPGNHASLIEWIVSEMIRLHYEGCPDVVVSGNVRPFDSFLIGESLIVIDHGKGISSLSGWKAKASLDVVARSVAGDDFFSARRIYYFVGHLHELQSASHGDHAKLIRLPSFGESDEFESSLRYASEPVAHLYAHDPSGRLIGDEWVYLSHGGEQPAESG